MKRIAAVLLVIVCIMLFGIHTHTTYQLRRELVLEQAEKARLEEIINGKLNPVSENYCLFDETINTICLDNVHYPVYYLFEGWAGFSASGNTLPKREVAIKPWNTGIEEKNVNASTIRVGLCQGNKLITWYTPVEGEPKRNHMDFNDVICFDRPNITLDPQYSYCEIIYVADQDGHEIVYNGMPIVYTYSGSWRGPEEFAWYGSAENWEIK